MSDFLTADIDELLNPPESETENEYDKAYESLLERDRQKILGFTTTRKEGITWPEPVRKRHIR